MVIDTLNSDNIDLYTESEELELHSDDTDLNTQDLEPEEEEKQKYHRVTVEQEKTSPSSKSKLNIDDIAEFMMKFTIESDTARIFLQLDENESYDATKHQEDLLAAMKREAKGLEDSLQKLPFSREALPYVSLMMLYDVLVLIGKCSYTF